MNKIYCGNNLDVMTKEILKESINLIYLDPPFFSTNRQYQNIWNDKNEIEQYKERNKLGIEGYINWIEPRLYTMKRLLKSTGSIYLHCDHHTDAHMRILMDDIFGVKNFKNEIIWSYRSGGASKSNFARKHDTILFYSKSNNNIFNIQRIPYDAIISKKSEHLYHKDGKMMNDVWDISILSSISKKRLGYKTQKPEELLERIIKASSNLNDIVLDPFMGGGTTLAVAKKLGRQFIGIDIAKKACNLTVKRIEYPKNKIINITRTIPDFDMMKTYKFQEYVCDIFNSMNPLSDPTNPSGSDSKFIGEFKGWGLSATASKLTGTEIKECIDDMVNRGYKNAQLISAKPISENNRTIAREYLKDSKLYMLELHYISDLNSNGDK